MITDAEIDYLVTHLRRTGSRWVWVGPQPMPDPALIDALLAEPEGDDWVRQQLDRWK